MVPGVSVDNVIQVVVAVITIIPVVLTWVGTRKVHKLVNQQHDILVDRTEQLANAIQEAGGKIPPSPPR